MSTFCTTTCTPCPPPIDGRGKGASKCEQNGVCQRISFDNAPCIKIEMTGNGRFSMSIEKKQNPLLGDEKCYALAGVFLSDHVIVERPESLAQHDLAQSIQDAIESTLEAMAEEGRIRTKS